MCLFITAVHLSDALKKAQMLLFAPKACCTSLMFEALLKQKLRECDYQCMYNAVGSTLQMITYMPQNALLLQFHRNLGLSCVPVCDIVLTR